MVVRSGRSVTFKLSAANVFFFSYVSSKFFFFLSRCQRSLIEIEKDVVMDSRGVFLYIFFFFSACFSV